MTPTTNPALSPDAASAYLGVSRRHFERHIAPHLPCADLRAPGAVKPMPRYRVADLDAFLAGRTMGAVVVPAPAA